MEQLKQLAIQNNTTGASIYDLGNIIKSESIAELTGVLKAAEQKTMDAKRSEQEHQQKMQQEMLAAQEKEKQMEMQFKAEQADLDRQNNIIVSEIRSAGFGSQSDINQNLQSDYLDAMERIEDEQRYNDQMNLKRESEIVRKEQGEQKLNIERQKLQTQREIADKQLQIAKENKNKYDVKKSSEKKK